MQALDFIKIVNDYLDECISDRDDHAGDGATEVRYLEGKCYAAAELLRRMGGPNRTIEAFLPEDGD